MMKRNIRLQQAADQETSWMAVLHIQPLSSQRAPQDGEAGRPGRRNGLAATSSGCCWCCPQGVTATVASDSGGAELCCSGEMVAVSQWAMGATAAGLCWREEPQGTSAVSPGLSMNHQIRYL